MSAALTRAGNDAVGRLDVSGALAAGTTSQTVLADTAGNRISMDASSITPLRCAVRSSFAERVAPTACAALAAAPAIAPAPRPASAIPIFAQRYHLTCETCHSVLPELNAFGNAFRDNGYRIAGLKKHGTTVAALREQIGYTPTPTDGTTRKTVPAGAALGALEVGQIEAFVHESLGSEGSTASLFLGYLAYGNQHTGTIYRLGS